MFSRVSNSAIGATILLVLLAVEVAAQDMLDLKVPEFEIKNATMEEALKKLRVYGVPVCLEKVPEGREEEVKISLRLENASIKEILDSLVKADPRYVWERYFRREDNGISGPFNLINVLPVGAKEAKDNLMNIRARRVEIKDKEAEEAIASIRWFVPELDERLKQMYPGPVGIPGSVARIITPPGVKVRFISSKSYIHLILEDVTVREVLNEVALASGKTCWVYEYNKSSPLSHRWRPF